LSAAGDASQGATGLKRAILRRYDRLSAAERRVADTVLSRGAALLDDTIASLAQLSGVSEPTVVRFCRSVGFSGMKELKRAALPVPEVARPEGRQPQLEELRTEDDVVSFVTTHKHHVLEELHRTLDRGALAEAIRLLDAARSVRVAGLGGSAVVVRHAQHYFRRIGIQCSSYAVYEPDDIAVERYAPGDVVLAVSYSGDNALVVDIVADAKRKGAAVIGILPWGESRLHRLADVALQVPFRGNGIVPGHHGLERTAQIAIVDMLFTGLYVRRGLAGA
jgi:RpiR family carbohydrate utilization transcriptional regulator